MGDPQHSPSPRTDRWRRRPLGNWVEPFDQLASVRCGHHAADRFFGDQRRELAVELVALDEMVVQPRRLEVGAQPCLEEVRRLNDQHGAQAALLVDEPV